MTSSAEEALEDRSRCRSYGVVGSRSSKEDHDAWEEADRQLAMGLANPASCQDADRGHSSSGLEADQSPSKHREAEVHWTCGPGVHAERQEKMLREALEDGSG